MIFYIRLLVLLFILMVDIRWFSFVILNYGAYLAFAKYLSVIMFFYVILNWKYVRQINGILVKQIVCFMLFPFISILMAALCHDQDLLNSLNATSMHLGYSLFFLLLIWKVPYNSLLKIVLVLGLIWCLIQIIQQITAPVFLFSNAVELLKDEEIGNQRNGIYRYSPIGDQFGLIFLFYFFQQYLQKKNVLLLIAIVLGLLGIYFTATRQIIAVTLFCIVIGLFIQRKIKVSSYIGILVLCTLIMMNFDALFGQFVEQTADKDDISTVARLNAYRLYGLELNDWNPFTIILGNGDPGRGTLYQRYIQNIEMRHWAVRADVGIVGMYYTYGLIYITVIFIFFLKIIRKWKFVDLYLKLFVIFIICTSPMLWHFGYSSANIGIYSFIYYLLEKNIQKNLNSN